MGDVPQIDHGPPHQAEDPIPKTMTEALRKLWSPRALGAAIAW